jgi:hypothetical protein
MNLEEFSPVGTTFCEGICDREVLLTPEGTIVVCQACKRIVFDNR